MKPIQLARVTEYTSTQYDFLLLYEVDCVIDHILKTLLIRKGSYVFDPEYGSDLLFYLFEPLDTGTTEAIRGEVKRVCEAHPSVSSVNVSVSSDVYEKTVLLEIQLLLGSVERTVSIYVDRLSKEVKTIVV